MTRASQSDVYKLVARYAVPMLSVVAWILTALALPIPAVAEATINCLAGTYDMLDWMTLDSDLRSTHHLEGSSNPLYTVMQSGKFYWVKGGFGYPRDIQLYDTNYVYLWITELSWTVPVSYKKFTNNTNLPLVPRCAIAGTPGSTIKVANTNYDLHTNCSQSCSTHLNAHPAYPLFTLRSAYLAVGLAQNSRPSGSLLLSREELSSSTSCRFSPAHCNSDLTSIGGLLI